MTERLTLTHQPSLTHTHTTWHSAKKPFRPAPGDVAQGVLHNQPRQEHKAPELSVPVQVHIVLAHREPPLLHGAELPEHDSLQASGPVLRVRKEASERKLRFVAMAPVRAATLLLFGAIIRLAGSVFATRTSYETTTSQCSNIEG